MKIDLLEIQEYNKKIKKEQEEINFKKELRNLISAIIKDDEEYTTDSKMLIDKIGLKIKFKSRTMHSFEGTWVSQRYGDYATIKLNKETIKKINDYLNKEE